MCGKKNVYRGADWERKGLDKKAREPEKVAGEINICLLSIVDSRFI